MQELGQGAPGLHQHQQPPQHQQQQQQQQQQHQQQHQHQHELRGANPAQGQAFDSEMKGAAEPMAVGLLLCGLALHRAEHGRAYLGQPCQADQGVQDTPGSGARTGSSRRGRGRGRRRGRCRGRGRGRCRGRRRGRSRVRGRTRGGGADAGVGRGAGERPAARRLLLAQVRAEDGKGGQVPTRDYRCAVPGCKANKTVERSGDGECTEVIYKEDHNHPQSVQPWRRSSAQWRSGPEGHCHGGHERVHPECAGGAGGGRRGRVPRLRVPMGAGAGAGAGQGVGMGGDGLDSPPFPYADTPLGSPLASQVSGPRSTSPITTRFGKEATGQDAGSTLQSPEHAGWRRGRGVGGVPGATGPGSGPGPGG